LSDLELREEVRLLPTWDQALTLLWFEDAESSGDRREGHVGEPDEDVLLDELDGTLKWPGKRRRR